ncbi:MAG: Tol-Pal system beta propeller repeat protein TolB [Cucumibacter sp.]
MTVINRRQALQLGLAGACVLAGLSPAQALVRIIVTGGDFVPLPIAIPAFAGSDIQLGIDAANLVTANLRRSGLFAPLDPAGFPVAAGDINATPQFAAWDELGADALVMGQVTRNGNQIQANVRLWDTVAGEQIFGSTYATDQSNWRRIAHIVSDAIYSALTGESGYFDSRLVYVAESGPKANRQKRLVMIDSDGANPVYLTDGRSLVLTPRFSPDNRMLSYVSYVEGNPHVFLLEIATGRQQGIGNFGQMSFSPRFSPDGGRLVFSSTNAGNTNLVMLELASGRAGQLSSAAAIDTSPSFSPDGARIAFESDRGGAQQLYVMAASGGGAQRISFGEGIYSTPSWSPKGDLIAFTRKSGDEFSIGTMRPDGTGERILVTSFHNEGPTWAPNGRVLMFWRDLGGNDGPRLFSVDVWGRNEQVLPTATFASDPTWSPLLG